jgi:hypothetical protein
MLPFGHRLSSARTIERGIAAMALSALDDLAVEPTGDQIVSTLREGMGPWTTLQDWLSESNRVNFWEWYFAGKKYGWTLRGKKGKRTIVYLIPRQGSFLVGLVLGDRAIEVVRRTPLSPDVLGEVLNARRYVEGTGFRLPVSSLEDLEDIKKLVEIKIAN